MIKEIKNTINIKNIIIIGFIILFIFIWYTWYNTKELDLKTTYSQFKQDLDVIEYLKHKKNGYFIDIGATNGIDISNTYLLEKKYNWNGICIEPQDSYYNKLIKNRKCHTDNSLVFSEAGKELNFSEAGDLGGITDYIDISKQTKKTTDTLNNILIKYNAPRYIDYMSLDTEGSELEILKGIDFDKYKFGIMNIEHNNVEPRRTNIRKFLENKGYKFYKEKDVDDFYIS